MTWDKDRQADGKYQQDTMPNADQSLGQSEARAINKWNWSTSSATQPTQTATAADKIKEAVQSNRCVNWMAKP